MADPEDETEDTLAGLTFEAALERLEGIVRRLEAGEVDLEESIRIYEEGVKIKAFCEKKLGEAQERVEKIVLAPDGGVKTEPTEIP
jgi:exodeoxyribonuclease VII small subunit